MCNRLVLTIATFLTFTVWAHAAFAQSERENWTIDFSGAAAPTVSDHLKKGWAIDVGAERRVSENVGFRGDFNYYNLGVSRQVLQALQVPSGAAHMFSLTVGPTWRFPLAGDVRGYALGGVGWYRRTVEFLEPTLGAVHIIDPWWGYLGSELVVANQILGSTTSNALGVNIGGGVMVPLGDSGSEVFSELRYHHANTRGTSTALVPISFGIRWGGRTLSQP
jgi:Outer membrane protein beta-barrel domain